MTSNVENYLPDGLPAPAPSPDGLDREYWEGTKRGELKVQQCSSCGTHQWGPEWICHNCLSFDVGWADVGTRARIFSWERIWHPVHPAVIGACPYVAVLVEFPGANNVRMVGNLLGDPMQQITIGGEVEAVFEHHADHTLVQWRAVD